MGRSRASETRRTPGHRVLPQPPFREDSLGSGAGFGSFLHVTDSGDSEAMDAFRLPAGTIVKHGTRTGAVAGIVANGLRPVRKPAAPRARIEPRPVVTEGCYVGWFTPFFGAYASWAVHAHQLALSVHKSRGHVPSWFQLELPAVVAFEIREPVGILADEDFVALPQGAEARDFLHSRRSPE